MDEKGYALVLRLLPDQYCEDLPANMTIPISYRKTVTMERHSFGLGSARNLKYPLPDPIELVRKEIYQNLHLFKYVDVSVKR